MKTRFCDRKEIQRLRIENSRLWRAMKARLAAENGWMTDCGAEMTRLRKLVAGPQ